jgi:hypothetical protein
MRLGSRKSKMDSGNPSRATSAAALLNKSTAVLKSRSAMLNGFFHGVFNPNRTSGPQERYI